ncbi:MAG: flagellar protein FlgN [Novosphingobium sp.]
MTAAAPLGSTLRQIVAVLQAERQALAALDLDGILGCATTKQALCDEIEGVGVTSIDEECRGLLDSARRLNEVNRQVRNLLAANVAARLDALTGAPAIYRKPPGYAAARG